MSTLPRLLDVSNWQKPVDWHTEYRTGLRYAYCKVSQGATFTDPAGARNLRAARAAGVHAGGYHFASPGVGTPEAQADRLLALAPTRPGSLRPCVDCESNPLGLNHAQLAAWYLGFVIRCHRRTGYWPTIYGSRDYLQYFALYHPEAFGSCPLWIADWGVTVPSVPAPWSHWAAWQWTDNYPDGAAHGKTDSSFLADAKAITVPRSAKLGSYLRRRP